MQAQIAHHMLLRGTLPTALAGFTQHRFGAADAVTRGDGTDANCHDNLSAQLRTLLSRGGRPQTQMLHDIDRVPAALGRRLRAEWLHRHRPHQLAGGQFLRLTWGDGSAAHRGPLHYEIEPLQQSKFVGWLRFEYWSSANALHPAHSGQIAMLHTVAPAIGITAST